MKSFFSKIGSFFTGLFKNPNMLQTVQSTLGVIGPILVAVAQTADPAAAPLIKQVVYECITTLGTVIATLHDVQVNGTANPTAYGYAANLLEEVSANVDGLLAAGHVKNPGLVTSIQTVVAEINNAISILKQNPVPVNNNVVVTAPTASAATTGA